MDPTHQSKTGGGMKSSAAIIPGSGEGDTYAFRLPKALHPICGRPMLESSFKNTAKERV